MATSEDLETTLANNLSLFDDGLFVDEYTALRYYSGNVAKLTDRRAIPLDEFQAACDWLTTRKSAKVAGGRTSRMWKGVMERETHSYVSDGAFIAAALFLEIPISHHEDTPHPYLGLKEQKGDY